MNIQARKLELVDLILKTKEISLLEKMSRILKKEEDWWDELPDSVKESIDIGLKQAEKGEAISHETLVQEMKAKYGLE